MLLPRLALAHAQGDDQRGCCDCNKIPCGSICGVPIKWSIYLLLFCMYSAESLARQHVKSPIWVFLVLAIGGMVLLFATILVHEFGHGLTAKHYGGEIHYILLWPLGGLCVASLPQQHMNFSEKLWSDWWVTFNGPATHFLQLPFWAVLVWSLYHAYDMRYSLGDFWADVNPMVHQKSLGRHPEALALGWGPVVAMQLCVSAMELNVLLFLFNVLFPMYPLDASKLLVTGLQLCGVRTRRAAWTFIWISGFCAALLGAWTVWSLTHWYKARSDHGMEEREIVAMHYGMLPIPLSVLLSGLLAAWGAKQTWDLWELGTKSKLHTHALFCHMPRRVRRIRDLENGRPDLFLDQTFDESDSEEESVGPPANRQAAGYGAVRLVDGRIVREDPRAQGLLPRQVIVPQ
eukprot:TRINITY_DN47629_c0_g1_i1.p1 TRINITY_DN47629_c0_g1~~TRINITY_DN47629_c0_g1_i1.p1  ORF type:complete len:403 (+),score=66.81 TRINITY_DN47629_c0_g1_i1:162-1370(+)